MAKRDDDKRQAESRRILKDVDREGDFGSSFAGSSLRRARDHLSARDRRSDDWVELWGTRIGRILAVCFAIVLIVWLVGYLTR